MVSTANPAVAACLTPAQKAYEQNVTVPEQTITRVLNPPTTNTATSNYSVAGVDPANDTTGLITKSQLVKGTWFTADPADEVLVYTNYATSKKLTVGGTLTDQLEELQDRRFGLAHAHRQRRGCLLPALDDAEPRLGEGVMRTRCSFRSRAPRRRGGDRSYQRELPGATVLTSKQLADSVSGSLNNAHKLANDLGGVLAIVVLLAAFLIAGLLTLSSVAKRVREIGSLRAIGWTRGEVVRQVMAETVGIGIVGGVIGVAIGAGVCAVIAAVGPGLSVTSTGLAVGASKVSGLIAGATNTGTVTSIVHLSAPIHATTILIAFAGALVGGVIAGMIGGGVPPGSPRLQHYGTSDEWQRQLEQGRERETRR